MNAIKLNTSKWTTKCILVTSFYSDLSLALIQAFSFPRYEIY